MGLLIPSEVAVRWAKTAWSCGGRSRPGRPSDHEAVRFGHLGAGVGKLSTLRPIGGSDATFVVIRGAGRALVAWI